MQRDTQSDMQQDMQTTQTIEAGYGFLRGPGAMRMGGTTGHGGGNRAMFETVCPRHPDLHPTMGGLKKGPTACMQL